jgi:hypothetical protein
VQVFRRSRVRFALIAASLAIALAQALSAPADAHHHADSGANAVFHLLGPALLAVVPLFSLLLICVGRFRGTELRTLHVPTFALVVASTEAAGLLLGVAHHGVWATLLLAIIGITCACLSIAAGATIMHLVRRDARRTWPRMSSVANLMSTDLPALGGRLALDTASLRGPPSSGYR